MLFLKDLPLILYWWFIIFSLGLAFLPLTVRIFSRFFDRGYLFSKTIALGSLSYLVWLGAHLRVITFSQPNILAITGLFILTIAFFSLKTASFKKKTIQSIGLTFIKEELIFLLALLFWSFIRGFQPNIQGLEKFMDFGFVNAILRSRYFPPKDMWFAGKPINYYYYGHYLTAFLTKMSGIDAAVTYNLMIATLFALTFSLTFSLTGNLISFSLKKSKKIKIKNGKLIIIGGLLSAFLICLGSNLHTPIYLLKNGPQKYWYPDATRYIGYNPPTHDKTIHEFPAYSFVVADLHGHVSDIPFVLTFIALAFNLFTQIKNKKQRKILSFELLVLSFTLAIMYMTNAWDLPVYLLLAGLLLLLKNKLLFKKNYLNILLSTAPPLILIITGWFLFTLPFNLNFQQITQGIGWVHSHTPLYQLLVLWGSFLFFAIIMAVFFLLFPQQKISDYFTIILITTAFLLIIIPETVYVKDIYSPDYYRANTMFKFTYQAYIMMAISCGYIITRTLSQAKKLFLKILLFFSFFIFYVPLLIYPFFSLPGYYGQIKLSRYQGLYGLNFLAQKYPEDYQAILWLKKIKGQPVVLEAAGDSYTDDNRVSMATGLPTIEGWLVHEWLWRGGYEKPQKRAQEVAKIYQESPILEAQEILKKYHVRYIFYGARERIKYPQSSAARLKKLGQPVYQVGKTIIYQTHF